MALRLVRRIPLYSNQLQVLKSSSRALSTEVAPEVKPPEVKPPEVKPPEVKTPEVKPPEVKPPEVKTHEVLLPETEPAPSIVWSCNEWDPLEEVIVGTADGATVPRFSPEIKATCPQASWDFFATYGGQRYPNHFIDKCKIEVEELCNILTAEGVVVRRPEAIDFSEEFSTPDFTTTGYHAANPRDCLLVVADEIIESPMTWRCRYYDYHSYRPLVKEYFRQGARWSQAPKATLKNDLFVRDYDVTGLEDRYKKANENRFLINEFEPAFDAADFMRAGRDIFAQRSQVTNLSGIEWVRRHLAPRGINVHQLSFHDSSAMHIDATFNIIGPGLALENPARPCRERDWLLKRGWKLVTSARPSLPDNHPMHVATKWLCMNVLMLDPERVMVEAEEVHMHKQFVDLGFQVIKVPFRHAYTFGGGLHCWTTDIRRRGKLESYM